MVLIIYSVDLTGMKFNNLFVIGHSHKNKRGKRFWKVKCDCGNIKNVIGSSLSNGYLKSCGCLKTKHNLTDTITYSSWSQMKCRCINKKHDKYKYYGGRGIKICDKWMDFTGFYEDMGDRPDGKTLDRIDVNGDYCKENCKWSTFEEQCNNRRSNVEITYNNKTQNRTQWEKELGMKKGMLYQRITERGWTIEKALSTPVKSHLRK